MEFSVEEESYLKRIEANKRKNDEEEESYLKRIEANKRDRLGVFDISLSNAVKQFPELYDSSTLHFRDKDKRKMLWEQIATDLGIQGGGAAADKLFWNLRKRYNKHKMMFLRLRHEGVDSMKSDRSSIDKYDFLKWLDRYVKPRSSRHMAEQSSDTGEWTEEEDFTFLCGGEVKTEEDQPLPSMVVENNVHPTTTETYHPFAHNNDNTTCVLTSSEPSLPTVIYQTSQESIPLIFTQHSNIQRMRKPAVATPQIVGSSTPSIFATPSSAKKDTPPVDEKDESDLFSKLVATQLKTLPRKSRLKAQNAIQNIIYEAMIENEEN